MYIYQSWFDIQEDKTDIENVFSFLQDLPRKIDIFTRDYNSNFFVQLRIADSRIITAELFLAALEEASNQLFISLNVERERLNNDNAYAQFFNERLAGIGFTNNSIRFKAATLNFHWTRVTRRVGNAAGAVIDFANRPIVRLLRRFFHYLNSILGSLTSVIPGAEGIKEVKEIIESYLGIADE
jgi:hypothetical protein